MPNLAQLRADTPGVEHRLHLNNAGASLMPRSVLDVMRNYLKRESEPVHRRVLYAMNELGLVPGRG